MEAFEALVRADIGKHRFDHGHAMAVDLFTVVGIDTLFHPIGVIR